VEQALSSKVLVNHRGPGWQGTTLINAILRIPGAQALRILLCAPTGGRQADGETTGLRPKPSTGCWSSTPAAFGFKRNAELALEMRICGGGFETSMVRWAV